MKHSFRKQRLMNEVLMKMPLMEKPRIKKHLMISALAVLLAACNGGGKGHAEPSTLAATVNELDPGSITADTPPIAGNLPAELLPPTQG